MKTLTKRILSLFAGILTASFCCFSVFSPLIANAEDRNYSDVMSDLGKDETFSENSYPSITNDYSLKVIQIAESEDDELFIYVYQPCHYTVDLVATRISMYYGESADGEDFTPQLYDLELLSNEGVFDKYIVKDFSINDDAERFYNIVAIYRPFSLFVGDELLSIGKTEEKAYRVAQQWHVCNSEDSLVYEMHTFETVEIDVKANGYLYFESGFQWSEFVGAKTQCDAHFIAFDFSDVHVSHIYDADLTYKVRSLAKVGSIYTQGTWSAGSWQTIPVRLTDVDVVEYNDGAIFSSTYRWNRIMSSKDFVENIESQGGEFYEVDRDTLLSSQWVFAFCETERASYKDGLYTTTIKYDVDDVAVLRIHYKDFSGKVYNLGVVSDITSSDDDPSGVVKPNIPNLCEIIQQIISVLLGGVLIFAFLKFLVFIFTNVFKMRR